MVRVRTRITGLFQRTYASFKVAGKSRRKSYCRFHGLFEKERVRGRSHHVKKNIRLFPTWDWVSLSAPQISKLRPCFRRRAFVLRKTRSNI